MAYSPSTRIDSKPQGGWTRDAVEAEARKRGAKRLPDLRLYLDTVYGQDFLNPEIVAIQSAHETGWWTSYWYEERLNMAGIGITGDPNQNAASKTWTNGRDAARSHMTHVWLYARGTDLPAGFPGSKAEDPRWDAAVAAGYAGTKPTLASLTNTWAIDSQYAEKLVAILNQREADTPPADDGGNEQEAPMAGYKAHDWSHIGFPGGKVYLPDWIPVEIKIISSSVAGWTSGQKLRGQTSVTWHDTANDASSAQSEWSWAAGGGRAGINSPGSYNGIWDKGRIIIAQRFDELVGHAGVPSGNRTSWAFEQAYGPGFDVTVGVALFGGIIAAMDWSVDTGLRKHQDWSGKWCPGQILNRGMWPQVQAMVAEAARKARAAADGVDPASPIAVGATVATTVALNVRERAGTSAPILRTLPAGDQMTIDSDPRESDGYTWWRIMLEDGSGGWVAEASADGLVPYLVVTKDAPAPEPEQPDEPETPAYAKPLAIAELAPYVGRPIVPMPATIPLADGGIAVPVFDRFRAVRDTRRRQTFDGPDDTGPMLKAGSEFDGSFTVIRHDAEPMLVTSWWTRIALNDLEVISDVPRDLPAAAEAA